jgi:anti-sigma factor RsiW
MVNENENTYAHVHTTVVELLPEYALGLLAAPDEQAVSAHLADCPECRLELEELRETTSHLAFAAPPAMPSPAVKAALLARVERLAATPAGGTPTPILAAVPPPGTNAASTPPHLRQWRSPRYALAAVAAVALLTLGGWNIALQRQLHEQQLQAQAQATQAAEQATVARLIANPAAAHTVFGPVTGQYGALPPAGYIYVDPNSTTGVMLTYWLPHLAPNTRYQLWLITPDGKRDSGGLFTVDGRGNASVVIHAPAPFSKYNAIGVTAEPYDGSPQPTTPRVIGGAIQ